MSNINMNILDNSKKKKPIILRKGILTGYRAKSIKKGGDYSDNQKKTSSVIAFRHCISV